MLVAVVAEEGQQARLAQLVRRDQLVRLAQLLAPPVIQDQQAILGQVDSVD